MKALFAVATLVALAAVPASAKKPKSGRSSSAVRAQEHCTPEGSQKLGQLRQIKQFLEAKRSAVPAAGRADFNAITTPLANSIHA